MKLSDRSLRNMRGIHPELIAVIQKAAELTTIPFIITSGVRTAAQQNALFKRGASKLDGYKRKSRHQQGCAFDVAVVDDRGRVTWDWPPYEELAAIIKNAASRVAVPIEWGGDWKSFKDGPHYQLPRNYVREYKSNGKASKPGARRDPVLQYRSSNKQAVVRLQKLLQKKLDGGGMIRADGIFGPNTLSAVRRFQHQAGLKADGWVGPKTWAALRR